MFLVDLNYRIDLLEDPEIDVIYNPVRTHSLTLQLYLSLTGFQLPNGLHYEWTMKALAAGKHVLLEKPSTDTAEETRTLFDFAHKKGLVLLEAFHPR